MSTDARSGPPAVRHAVSGTTMGTRYTAVFHAPAGIALHAVETALQASVDAVDRQMSNWKPDSDLCRFNRADVGEWVGLPQELLAVIAAAIEMEEHSGGAFDAGVGAIVAAWGFGPAGAAAAP
ncbi:FAD:protein FMN transferase, partial [Devosia sp.]|uniref:FAD:protein FMN transferase n=1 Tax=Devosia sp. TaxID=1871048 RepID=UPI002EE4CA7E